MASLSGRMERASSLEPLPLLSCSKRKQQHPVKFDEPAPQRKDKPFDKAVIQERKTPTTSTSQKSVVNPRLPPKRP
ncbi:unnamed protein product [Orchesella dallaii]|uniref:Uncharacterized protein n=1 Tax=Orchesella dallaii TaxID=48710 RepID=A0ABP1QTH6_9HEXA